MIEIRQFLKSGVPTILALAIAFAVGAIFMLVAEVDPLYAYSRMFFGTLGSTYYISETLVRMLPLLLGALGGALAFRAGFWNIGMEGQILLAKLEDEGINWTDPKTGVTMSYREFYWKNVSREQRMTSYFFPIPGKPPEEAIIFPFIPEWAPGRESDFRKDR